MAWSLLGSGTTVFATSGTVYTYPAGAPASGNLLVLGINSDTTVSTPTGYTLSPNASFVGGQGAYVYWRIAGASEPTTITITTSGNFPVALSYRRYSGNLAAPFDVANNANHTGFTNTTPAVSLGPLAGSGELLLCYAMLHTQATTAAATSPVWTGGPTQVASTDPNGDHLATGHPAVYW